MKKTTVTGVALTLLMLLLVLLAAFVFLFQGRQTVIDQRDGLESRSADLQQDLAQTELSLDATEATRAATADSLATAESNAVLLDGELVRSQQELDALTAQLDGASQTITTLQDAQDAVLSQPPEVAILSPRSSSVLALGDSVDIVLVATDIKGIASINLTINEEAIETEQPNGESLFTAVSPWQPTESNEYVIELTAINSEGISSRSATVTMTVALVNTTSRPANDANSLVRDDIDSKVSGLRQLSIPEGANQLFVTGVALRQAQQDDANLLATSELWADAGLFGQAFDFAPADFDYATLLQEVYSQPTAALYRPLSGEMLLIEQDDTLTAVAQLGYVRQLLYLMQDQNFGLDSLTTGTQSLDATLALAALHEGEATIVQENFLVARYLPLDTAVIPETYAINRSALATAPTAVANRLLFPYDFGADFARLLYDTGNYIALDAAWGNPPQSTEQILHPEKYAANEGPSLVSLPDLLPILGDGWELVESSVLGEFMLGQYLGQQLDETQTETAVSGWGGDSFAIYTNEADGSFLMALHTVWDTAEDSTEFAALYPNYPTRLFSGSGEIQANGGECWAGDEELICLYQSEQETLIVRGPEFDQLLTVVETIFPTE